MSKTHPRLNYKNICNYCKQEFHPFCREAKYCSYDCSSKEKRTGKFVNCSYCKKRVYKQRKWFGVVRLFYCNKECKNLDSRYEKSTKEIRGQVQWFVSKAIKDGRLIKKPCKVCGDKKADAHHYLGYDKKHWLDVKWLCRSHHSLEHQEHVRRKHKI